MGDYGRFGAGDVAGDALDGVEAGLDLLPGGVGGGGADMLEPLEKTCGRDWGRPRGLVLD